MELVLLPHNSWSHLGNPLLKVLPKLILQLLCFHSHLLSEASAAGCISLHCIPHLDTFGTFVCLVVSLWSIPRLPYTQARCGGGKERGAIPLLQICNERPSSPHRRSTTINYQVYHKWLVYQTWLVYQICHLWTPISCGGSSWISRSPVRLFHYNHFMVSVELPEPQLFYVLRHTHSFNLMVVLLTGRGRHPIFNRTQYFVPPSVKPRNPEVGINTKY